MWHIAWVFALISILTCSPRQASAPALTDAQFVDLFIEVFGLCDRYETMPDSLARHRQAAFERRGIAPKDVAAFIAHRRENLELWKPVLDMIQEQLGEKAEVHLETFGVHTRADSTQGKKNGP